MQINVITQSVGVEETLGSCTAEQPIDADITLRDYCPDIRRVLKCLVTPRITAVQTAGDRATADGSAGVCVIYTDEQGNVCCFEQTYPFSKYADLKGADENCCVNVRAYTQYANCRAVSPRRLDIHAVVSVAFGISGVKEEEIITGAEGAGIQLRCCDSRTASLVACTETAFPMSETVPLPDGDPAVSCVLSAQAAALAQEIKVISNKLLVKGELTVSAVCRGEGGEIFSFGHSMPISQIINLEGIDEDCTCCVCLPVTSLEVLPKADQAGDNRLIDISARVGAGVKAYRELSFPTVTDAYSVCCDLETKSRNADFAVIADKFNDTFTCRSTQDLPEARQILALWCSDLSKSVAQDPDGIIISAMLRPAADELRIPPGGQKVRRSQVLAVHRDNRRERRLRFGQCRCQGRDEYLGLYLRQRPPQDRHFYRMLRFRRQKDGRRRADSLFCGCGRGDMGYREAV